MFPSEDYTRFYAAMRLTGAESSSMHFPGTPFVIAPTLFLVSEKNADSGKTMQRLTLSGLRVMYTPPAAGLISSWMRAYEEWDTRSSVVAASHMRNNESAQAPSRPVQLARMVSDQSPQDGSIDGDAFFPHHKGSLDFLIQVNDAQIKLVTIVPEGAALLVADILELHIGMNAKKQRLVRVIWKEYELYCSHRTDLWLDKRSSNENLPRILTKCSMEFDFVSSSDEVVLSGGAEAKGSLSIIAPVLLAHMSAQQFRILGSVFSKFFVVQTSMSEQHKELLTTIQFKLQLSPESVGDISALRNRVRSLGLEIKDLQSKIRDLETEHFMGNMSPVMKRAKRPAATARSLPAFASAAVSAIAATAARPLSTAKRPLSTAKRFGKRATTTAQAAAAPGGATETATPAGTTSGTDKTNTCAHCGDAFVNEAERVDIEDVTVHAKCVVEYRTSQASGAGADFKMQSRLSLLKQRLLQRQKTYQASSELLNLLFEGQRKVRQGANARPTWKLAVRVEQVHWHLMSEGDRMFCEVFLKHLTSSILLREDESGTIRMELNRVSILNHTPNTDSKYLHALQPLRAAVWSDRDVMIRVFASMRSPVGGISVYDHFEFNVTPLRVSITGDLWQHIYEYIFPALESTDSDKTKLAAAVQAAKVRQEQSKKKKFFLLKQKKFKTGHDSKLH